MKCVEILGPGSQKILPEMYYFLIGPFLSLIVHEQKVRASVTGKKKQGKIIACEIGCQKLIVPSIKTCQKSVNQLFTGNLSG